MYVVWRLQSVRLLNSTLWNPLRYCPPLALFLCHCPLLRFQRPRLVLSPVHTSDNVAKNGDIVAKNRDTVAETGDNVAKTGNIVFLATMLPDCCRFRRQCRLCGRDFVWTGLWRQCRQFRRQCRGFWRQCRRFWRHCRWCGRDLRQDDVCNGCMAVCYPRVCVMWLMMFYAAANSHRASIPALLMGRISISNPELDKRALRKYTLNALEGINTSCSLNLFNKAWKNVKSFPSYVVP